MENTAQEPTAIGNGRRVFDRQLAGAHAVPLQVVHLQLQVGVRFDRGRHDQANAGFGNVRQPGQPPFRFAGGRTASVNDLSANGLSWTAP